MYTQEGSCIRKKNLVYVIWAENHNHSNLSILSTFEAYYCPIIVYYILIMYSYDVKKTY